MKYRDLKDHIARSSQNKRAKLRFNRILNSNTNIKGNDDVEFHELLYILKGDSACHSHSLSGGVQMSRCQATALDQDGGFCYAVAAFTIVTQLYYATVL